MDSEDWQEAALTSRHSHNRSTRGNGSGGKGKKGGAGGAFDVRKALGTYELACPALGKLSGAKSRSAANGNGKTGSLQLFGFSQDGLGITGVMELSPALNGQARVVLAASRKSIKVVLDNLVAAQEPESESGSEGEGGSSDESSSEASDDDAEGESNVEDSDEEEQDRFVRFEKNSFRSPKFWLRWQADLPTAPATTSSSAIASAPEATPSSSETSSEGVDGSSLESLVGGLSLDAPNDGPRATLVEEDTGYLVFAGNDCKKFSATISCRRLGWKNVAVTGWKLKGGKERDVELQWLRTPQAGEEALE